MDELSKQRLGEVAQPLEAGQPLRYAYQYVRNGTRHLFMFFEPLAGQRFVQVTDHRTKIDWAYAVRDLVDSHYPAAERMTLVMDNLSSHSLGCLYEAFEPAQAKPIADRLDSHPTPKHASCLNRAAIEWAVLSGQCLDRRIPDHSTLKR